MYSWIEINKAHLAQNCAAFISLLGKERFAPVLKSNAYGHGLEPFYKLLSEYDPEWICVVYLQEAEILRNLGFQKNIFIVGPVPPKDYSWARKLDAQIPVYDLQSLASWSADKKRPLGHLKIDTGLTRLGLSLEELEQAMPQLLSCKESLRGVYSHFANVEDVSNLRFAHSQIDRLKKARQLLQDNGINLRSHISSSASSLIIPEARMDLCRIGISLYGFWPSELTKLSFHTLNEMPAFHLKPVLTWKTKVVQVRDIPRGRYIGYGCTFQAPHAMKIAVLPVGYNEGFPRVSSNKNTSVWFCGERCPVIGRICMNLMMIDITHVDSVDEKDPVTLIGDFPDVSATRLASICDTISYEIVTRLNPLIPRLLI